ncbi:hypothetical protein KEG38_23890 [Polyangium jinanense]|uniref:KAP family P-loop NTPase fold protein n=1 Tax=Polyangium jinanense TaxID=2829994 RepID=UPI002341327F|nr:P-loop NTPase fold protein [Polyangium jinanense]MDC3956923.1 hypothetical protein [Polyangium jinanense]
MADETRVGLPDLPLKPEDMTEAERILGLGDHAQALARFIAVCRTPMTIGIQGGWGTGKTSLMRMVEQSLKKEGVKTHGIWFNTWQYSQFSQEGRLAYSMLMNLTRKLRGVETKGWPTERARSAFKRFAVGLLKASALVAGTALGTRLAGGDFDGEKLLDAFQGEDERLDDAILFERLRDDFAEIVRQFKEATKCEKVVFYVDDLDRLQPARAIELLEVMKNFLDVDGAIFVLAIDYDVVVRGLQERKGYEDAGHMAEECKSFFDKLIQVPYRMPTASYKADRFLCEHFKDLHGRLPEFVDKNAKALLDVSIGNNPRSIKRLLNLHSLLRNLVVIKKTKKLADAQLNQLLVLTCIQMAYVRVYSLIAANCVYPGPEYVLVAFAMVDDIQRDLVSAAGDLNELNAEDAIEGIIRKVRQGEFKDVVKANEGAFADAVRLVANEIVHIRSAQSGRHLRNMSVLAKLLFKAIDTNNNKTIDENERKWLEEVLDLAKSTSVVQEEDIDTSAASRTARVNFYHLCAPGTDGRPLLSTDSVLLFRDPKGRDEGVFKAAPMAKPDVEHKGAFMKVTFEGSPQTLSTATREIFRRIQNEKPGAELFGTAEKQGTVPMIQYWVVEREGRQVPLSELVDQCRGRMSLQS